MNEKILQIAERHGLIIDSKLTEDKRLMVASTEDFIKCVKEIVLDILPPGTIDENLW
jgi:hypothetical protein